MNYLFDTHSFIWWANSPEQLSPQVLTICRNKANILLLSVASLWEIQIKHQLGKFELHAPLAKIVESQQQLNQIALLSITLPHIVALDSLPFHHKDPFDRMLIAQAQVEGAILLSRDSVFKQYPIEVIW